MISYFQTCVFQSNICQNGRVSPMTGTFIYMVNLCANGATEKNLTNLMIFNDLTCLIEKFALSLRAKSVKIFGFNIIKVNKL